MERKEEGWKGNMMDRAERGWMEGKDDGWSGKMMDGAERG